MVNKSKEIGYEEYTFVENIVFGDFDGRFFLFNCIFPNIEPYKLTDRIVNS